MEVYEGGWQISDIWGISDREGEKERHQKRREQG